MGNDNFVVLDEEQYTELVGELRQVNENVVRVESAIVHSTTFIILLVVFQFYSILSRARKKGGL